MGSLKNPCPGSGKTVELSWPPDTKGYAGGVICPACSVGLKVVAHTVQPYTYPNGIEVFIGRVRMHAKLPR